LPGLLAVKTHFWDKGHPDVEVYLRRRTIDGDWIWLVTKAVSYVDQPIPGIILLEMAVDDEQHASQVNRITRITAVLVQAVEAAQVASLNTNDNAAISETGSVEGGQIPWVADDAVAYQAMLQNASAAGVDTAMDDPLVQIMKAAAAGGAISKGQGANKLEQEIMERVGGKKESFDPFSVLEEVRQGVRLDFGMIRLSRSEVKMITLVLAGHIPVEDLCSLVFQALTSGFGIDAAMEHYMAHKTMSQNGGIGGPHMPAPPPILSVVNLPYTYMGNSSVDMLCEVIQMENSLLRTIDISFCGLEDRGCSSLAKAFTKRKRSGVMPLRGIILSGNHISYRAATDLGRSLSPGQGGQETRTRKHKRVKSGGYDEDSESDDDDFDGGDDMFGPRTVKKPKRTETNAASAKYLSKEDGLQVLHLGSTLKDADSVAQFLHGLGPLCPVKELSLTSNNIGPDGVKLIVDFLEGKGLPRGKQVMPFLDRLDLSNNRLGNEGLTKLTRAISKRNAGKVHLVELRLSNNGIGHGGIETMMNKLLQHNLVSLSLDKNAIGDQGCQLVAASLQSMKSLARLNLGFNQIGSRGVNSLMRSLVACDSLTYLALSGNIMKISGAVALAFTLAQHPRLEELDVDNCCLSQAAQCHIASGIISNRWVPIKRMNGFEAGPPMVALGALKISAQNLSNEECFRIRKDEQMKTILQWMESNRVAKMAGRGGTGSSSDAFQHFLTPDYVQSMNDVQGIPSQNPYLRLLGWLSRIPFDEDELISLRKYFYDSDGASEDRGSDGYINLKLRGDLLAALESDVADEMRDETPLLVQYVGSIGIDIDHLEGERQTASAWDYMRGRYLEKSAKVLARESASDESLDEAYNDGTSDDEIAARKRRVNSTEFRDMDGARGEQHIQSGQSARSSMSTMSRTSMRSMQHSGSDRSNVSQGNSERRRGGGLKARITMFPQFVSRLVSILERLVH
jgi:hypothetical protein